MIMQGRLRARSSQVTTLNPVDMCIERRKCWWTEQHVTQYHDAQIWSRRGLSSRRLEYSSGAE